MRPLWQEFIESRAFWLSYLLAGYSFKECPSVLEDRQQLFGEPYCAAQIRFAFPAGYSLHLDINPGEHSLQLVNVQRIEPLFLEVGRVDCHAMPDLLRWPEFNLLVSYLARRVRPAWACELLLCAYVAVTEDCAADRLSVLRNCLAASRLFSEVEVDYVTRQRGVRSDFRWVEHPELGWVAEGRGSVGSMRNRQAGFNFTAFRDFLAAVEGESRKG